MIVSIQPDLLSGSAPPGSLLYRHPEYNLRWWWREFGRLSYLGGREYHRPSRLSIEFQYPVYSARDQNGQLIATKAVNPEVLSTTYKTLLFRHDREKDWEFWNRQKRAHYHNFVRTVVNMLVSHATKREPTREGDQILKDFWEGVDQKRTTDIDNFTKYGLRWAAVKGIMWACVDRKSKDQGGDGNPYAYWVSPLDILDWDVDDDGNIRWLKQFCYSEAERDWSRPIQQRYEFRIWYPGKVEIHKTDVTGVETVGGQKIPRLSNIGVETRPTGIDKVPFVPLYSVRDEDQLFPDGTALAADLCKGANHVYNLGSLLSDILYKQTFSWLVIPDKNVDTLQMATSTFFGYDPQGSSAKPEYVSPDAKQAEVILAAITQHIEQMRQAIGVGRGRQESSRMPTTADGMELQNEDKRSILYDIATEAEAFERRLVDMVQLYRFPNATPTSAADDAVRIQYQREFDLRTLGEEVDEALSFKSLGLSPEINLEMAAQLVRRRFSGMPQDKLDELIKTLDAVKLAPPPQPSVTMNAKGETVITDAAIPVPPGGAAPVPGAPAPGATPPATPPAKAPPKAA